MIAVQLRVPLDEEEYAALVQVATDELRGPADQVRFILRQEFERRGLLGTTSPGDLTAGISSEAQADSDQSRRS